MTIRATIERHRENLERAQKDFEAKSADIEKRDDKSLSADEAKAFADLANRMADEASQIKTLQAALSSADDTKALLDRMNLSVGESVEKAHEDAARGKTVTLGEMFVGSAAYKALQDQAKTAGGRFAEGMPILTPPVGVKTLLTGLSDTSAGAFVQNDRFPELIDLVPGRPLSVRSVFRSFTTESDLVEYVRVTSKTNNAAMVLEATALTGTSGTKPSSIMTFEKVTTPVETIAHWIPATTRALADVGQLRALIDAFLREGLEEKIEDQLIAGNGTSPNLLGINNVSGTLGHVISTTLDMDEVLEMVKKVRVTGRRRPTFLGIHPDMWFTTDLAQKKDTTGRYILLSPTQSPDLAILWGLQVVVSEAFTAANPIVGDGRWAAVWDRENATIQASNQHSDFFVRNMVAILAEQRLAFGVMDPQAFCKATAA